MFHLYRLLNIFIDPITTLFDFNFNIIYRKNIEATRTAISRQKRYYDSSTSFIKNTNSIVRLITHCDTDIHTSKIDYLHATSIRVNDVARIVGFAIEGYKGNYRSASITGKNMEDIILVLPGYNPDDKAIPLKCLYHPYVTQDIRIPDGSWETKGLYTIWVLYEKSLFSLLWEEKKYYKSKDLSVDYQRFVFTKVLVRTMESIIDIATVNRAGAIGLGNKPVETKPYLHSKHYHSIMHELDDHLKPGNIQPSSQLDYRDFINLLPALDPKGMVNFLLLPDAYPLLHIRWIWILARHPIIVNVINAGGPGLRKQYKTEIEQYCRACKTLSVKAKALGYLSQEDHLTFVKTLNIKVK